MGRDEAMDYFKVVCGFACFLILVSNSGFFDLKLRGLLCFGPHRGLQNNKFGKHFRRFRKFTGIHQTYRLWRFRTGSLQ